MLQDNQLTAVESKEVNVNGFPALAVVADQQQQQQQQMQQQGQQNPAIRILAYFIQDKQTIYNFLGYAAQPDFQTYYPTFNSVMSNFRGLTDPDKINRQPDRIRIKTITRNATLQQALQQFDVPSDKLQDLAILNGMELTTQVKKGSLVKVIEPGTASVTRR